MNVQVLALETAGGKQPRRFAPRQPSSGPLQCSTLTRPDQPKTIDGSIEPSFLPR
jgi:hypothetical protein